MVVIDLHGRVILVLRVVVYFCYGQREGNNNVLKNPLTNQKKGSNSVSQVQQNGQAQNRSSSFLAQEYCQIHRRSNHTALKCWHMYVHAQTEDDIPHALTAM